MKKIVLVDGNSLMFRSYYATSYTGSLMKNSKGLYTNAIFGFVNMLTKLLNDQETDYIFIAFDAGKKTFRHQSFDGYKGTRKVLPEELKVQIPYIKEYLDILNIARYETLDFEADDLIATIAAKVYGQFDEIQVITGDKDLLQLVNDKVTVFLTKKGVGELEDYTVENFVSKMGITPAQITDYKGLVGDSSDNLPGIKGIGEKTAIKLLDEYHSLEEIYQHIEELKGKTQTLFQENEEIAKLCKYLATLRFDADIPLNITDMEWKKPNRNALIQFLKEMEFHSLLKRMILEPENEIASHEVKVISDIHFDFSILEKNTYIIGECLEKNYINSRLLGLGIVSGDQSFFVTEAVIQESKSLKSYLENENKHKKTFDFKQLYVIFKKYDIELKGITFDLLLSAYLLNPQYANEDIKVVSENFITTRIDYQENVYGSNSKLKIPEINVLSNYSIGKCLLIKELEDTLKLQIEETNMSYLNNIELQLSKVLGDIELAGLFVDLKKLDEIGIELSWKAEELVKQIYQEAEVEFNLNSPKQLGDVLFEKMKLPHGKKNKTGYSTNVEVLETLAKEHEIARKILEYRTYNKLVTTYVNGIKEVTNEKSFIHPLYKQALTLTGRLSSVEPNIQNMPIKTEVGQSIRGIFSSRFPNGVILSADYSQIELRVLAHMSKDKNMIDAFNQDVDFHRMTASNIYEIPLEEVTSTMRRTAKAINFGIIYGMSAWGLSETLSISPVEATNYITKYFASFPKAKEFLDLIVEECKGFGYTKTIYHRRRYIPEILSSNFSMKSFGERTAMNAPIQGSAADIIKIAMIAVAKRMAKNNLKSKMIAQVHDELVFDCIEGEISQMKKLVEEEMEKAVSLSVKLRADANYGTNWLETK